jgi:hypothetical protein
MKIFNKLIDPLKDVIQYKYIKNDRLDYNTSEMLSNISEYLDDEINIIYKINRKLDDLTFRLDIISHSGLLIETKNENPYAYKHFILEYGSGSNIEKNVIHLRPIYIKNIQKHKLIDNEYIWKIYKGIKINNKYTLIEAYNIMKNNMIKYKYNLYNWNCHIAQEITRKILGDKIKPYSKFTYKFIVYWVIILLSIIIIILLINIGIKKYNNLFI